jgi:hypothetical protein
MVSLPLSIRIAIYFASNPEMQLTRAEVAHKFGVNGDRLHSCIRYSVERGLIKRVWTPEPSDRERVLYGAGDKLMEEL